MNLYDTNRRTMQDFAELQTKEHCYLHIITLNPFDLPRLNIKTVANIRDILGSICIRLSKGNVKNQSIEVLEKLPMPYDIWLYEQETEEKYTNWLGKEKTRVKQLVSYNFIFDRKLTEVETAYWNFFIVGRYS